MNIFDIDVKTSLTTESSKDLDTIILSMENAIAESEAISQNLTQLNLEIERAEKLTVLANDLTLSLESSEASDSSKQIMINTFVETSNALMMHDVFSQSDLSTESIGESIKNVFKKIWDAIKKAYEWVKEKVSKFWNWIKSFFTSGDKDKLEEGVKISKDMNAIVTEVKKDPKDGTKQIKTKDTTVDVVVKSGKIVSVTSKDKSNTRITMNLDLNNTKEVKNIEDIDSKVFNNLVKGVDVAARRLLATDPVNRFKLMSPADMVLYLFSGEKGIELLKEIPSVGKEFIEHIDTFAKIADNKGQTPDVKEIKSGKIILDGYFRQPDKKPGKQFIYKTGENVYAAGRPIVDDTTTLSVKSCKIDELEGSLVKYFGYDVSKTVIPEIEKCGKTKEEIIKKMDSLLADNGVFGPNKLGNDGGLNPALISAVKAMITASKTFADIESDLQKVASIPLTLAKFVINNVTGGTETKVAEVGK